LSVTEEDIAYARDLLNAQRVDLARHAPIYASHNDMIDRLIAALASITTPSVPSLDGWKLVPVEPTMEMIQAGEAAHYAAKNRVTDARTADAYRAMLAASPEPSNLQNMQSAPSSPEGGGGEKDDGLELGISAFCAVAPTDTARVERGQVVWFSSEEDGGPDCGLEVGLGDGASVYVGELANATLEEHGIDPKQGDGWWIVLHDSDGLEIAGSVADQEAARKLADAIFAAMRP
jgi:hypothetical protein